MNDRATVTAFFDSVARDSSYEERYLRRGAINAYDISKRKELVLECLDRFGLRGGALLDVGCGPAVFTPMLGSRGFEIWGVDASPGVVALAREVMAGTPYGDRAHFSLGDVEHLDFRDGTFDAALAVGLFEYLPGDAVALRELHRVLKPGGIAIVTLQNRCSYYTVVRWLVRPLRPLLRALLGRRLPGRQLCGHHWSRSHTAKGFVAAARRSGFTPVGLDYVNFALIPFNLPIRLPRAYFRLLDRINDALWLRRRLHGLYGTCVITVRRDG